jgi:indolepyruvate ferredoxin oxidoreductase
MVTAASFDGLAKVQQGKTWSIINSHASVTGDFSRKPDMKFPAAELERLIEQATGAARTEFIDGTHIATTLLGDSIATNLFMLGYAYQKGLVPVSSAALERAIELNATAIESNKQAFLWGRRAAHDRRAVEAAVAAANPPPSSHQLATTLEEMVARRVEFLTGYQNAAYAGRYKALVERVARAEQECAPGLAEAVARYYFKLLAYKDEYEVARLYTDGSFKKQISAQFEGDYRLEFNLAPPLWAEDPASASDEAPLWAMDAHCIPAAGEIQGPARQRARYLRLRGRAEAGTATDRRLRAHCRRSAWRPEPRQPRARDRDRQHPRADPRLWPCEGSSLGAGQGARNGAAGRLARAGRAPAGGGIVPLRGV